MASVKLGLYVSDKCKTAAPNGKRWFEFRRFVRMYWRLLSSYTLLVSDSTAKILEDVAADLKRLEGVGPKWDFEVENNPRALVIKLVATKADEVERILLFLDPAKLSDELQSLWTLLQAVAEHGQKLNINWGARLWAENEWAARCGTQNKPVIGVDDAIVFVGQNAGLAIDRFALKHLDKVMLFPRFILTSGARAAVSELLRAADVSTHLPDKAPDGMQDIASLLVSDYFNISWHEVDGRMCHVIACAGRHRKQAKATAWEEFIQVCADPRMRVNLMLNEETAEEWIQQPFECRKQGRILQ